MSYNDLTSKKLNPLSEELDHIMAYTGNLWEELRGERLFITGGTGFFGCWLLESFAWANKCLNLNASALVLTRDYNAFKNKMPHLASDPSIQFQIGDIVNFTFPKGTFPFIIHAATPSDAALCRKNPLLLLDTIVEGTRHTLDFAVHSGTKKFLFTSSGAVYGKQPHQTTHIPESHCGSPDLTDQSAAYGEGKRTAELFCMLYSRKYNIEPKIARCFAFVGPYLPLDMHYAAGNFIRDGLRGGPIVVKGDGTPYRSYLYAADLAVWLWTILLKGKPCRPYNVGSEEAITVADLAKTVADCFDGQINVEIAKPPNSEELPERYVPSTKRVQEEFGVRQFIDLKTGIKKTISILRKNRDGYFENPTAI